MDGGSYANGTLDLALSGPAPGQTGTYAASVTGLQRTSTLSALGIAVLVPRARSGNQVTGVGHVTGGLTTMTYLASGNDFLHEGGNGTIADYFTFGGDFAVVNDSVLGVNDSLFVLVCDSNRSMTWLMTSPVCSTKFSSFFIFMLVTIVLSIITLWTVLGNILVLCALYRYRTLRTMSNVLIGNLAVSDLLLAVTVLPISTTNDLLGFWVFGRSMCTVWLCIDVLYCTASIWGLCTIAFDRYTATVYPMWYHDKRSTRKALSYVGFVWVFSIVISLAPFIGWQEMIPEFYRYDPDINRYRCVLFSTQSYVIYSAMGSFVLPSVLMTFLYVQIFVVLHKQSDTLKKKTSITGSPPAVSGQVNGCPRIAVSELHETTSCVVRDLTASTFVPDDEKDREVSVRIHDESEEDEEEEMIGPERRVFGPTSALKEPTLSRALFAHLRNRGQEDVHLRNREEDAHGEETDVDQDDSGVDRTSNTSDGSGQHHKHGEGERETSLSLLRDQRSNSLNVDMQPFRTGLGFKPQATKDFLTVSTCDIPWQFKLKKSQSACTNLQENGTGAVGGRGGGQVTRSKSATFLCAPTRRETYQRSGSFAQGPHGHSDSSRNNSMTLHRLSLPWHAKRNNHMTTSMRRRFQLREQRATKRMLLIMACFFVCWVPFTLMYMLRSLCEKCEILDEHAIAFIIWLGYVNSSLNPLLYTLFNDDFRKAFSKLLSFRRTRRSSRLP